MESKVIGIVGSRRRNSKEDYDLVEKIFLENYNKGDSLVSGGCPLGADRMAEIIAKKYNIPIKIHYADWDKYGKSAGFKRNTYIAEDCNILIACVSGDRTGGTEDTVKKAEKLGRKIILVPQVPQSEKKDFDPLDIEIS